MISRFDLQRQYAQARDMDALRTAASDLLHGRRTLIVLDNVEPNDPSAEGNWKIERVVDPLSVAGASILITARQAMPRGIVPIQASRVLDLLSYSEALDLFAHTYGYQDPTTFTEEQRSAVDSIVITLDRHTLAVKLAAAYASDAHRDLSALARELEIPGSALDLPDGEQPSEVRRALASSFEALPPHAKQLFIALGAFASPDFGRRAALSLADQLGLSGSPSAVDVLVLRALLDNYLEIALTPEEDRERLHLHPLVRDFAAAQFDAWSSEEQDAAYAALASYFVSYVKSASHLAIGMDALNIDSIYRWAVDRRQDAAAKALYETLQYYWGEGWQTGTTLRYLP